MELLTDSLELSLNLQPNEQVQASYGGEHFPTQLFQLLCFGWKSSKDC